MRESKKIAVIIPALNEERSIGTVVRAVPDWVDRIVVADNGSSDGTSQQARRNGAEVVREDRLGYGSACLAAMRELERTESPDAPLIVVFLDGDFADDPTQSWLWFLPVLFIFQMVYLGLVKLNLLSFKISLRTGVTLTLVIGLGYSMLISGMNLTGWFNSPLLHFQRERLLVYFMIFLLGTLCNKLNVFESNKGNKKFYILSNVVMTVSMGIFTVVALNLFFNLI